MARMQRTMPFGSWPSALGADEIAQASRSFALPRLHRGVAHWLERRPAEQGRQVVVAATPAGLRDRSPAGVDVRCRVHEYGGGDYGFVAGELAYVVSEGGGIRLGEGSRIAGTLPDARYGDMVGSPDGRWLVAVEEEAREGDEPANRLVAFERGTGRRVVVEGAHDFASSPCFAPDGTRLAYVTWDHPNMPWDGTELRTVGWGAGGPVSEPRVVAGGVSESVFQPGFSPTGQLCFVSDRSGWWNLCRAAGDGVVPLASDDAEWGRPQWALGMRSWGFTASGTVLAVVSRDGEDALVRLDPTSGRRERVALPFTALPAIDVEGEQAVLLAAGPGEAPTIVSLDANSGQLRTLATAFDVAVAGPALSVPRPMRFPSPAGGEAHAFLYPPAGDGIAGPVAERPPLLVKSHGGPTAATGSALKLATQFWTQRGFAVVDVNYSGSTGYGRAYRERLDGEWGVLDVADCIAAARAVSDAGEADPERWLVSGGSAGGYTTLCALTFHDVFAAGASHYGIGDLEALVRDTHKFESRYLERLVGPYATARERYVERSPIHFPERLSCPVIFFQGLEDKVVPPSQAEAMTAALAARGVRHAYVAFEGEGHGFRRAENIRAALEGELWFYGQVLGFETAAPAREIRLQGGGR